MKAKYKVGDKVYIEELGQKRETKIIEVFEGIFYNVLPYSVNGQLQEHEILGKVEENEKGGNKETRLSVE